MIVVLTGAPGAGKGTQADAIEEKLGFRKVSTGDALRRHIKAKTDIGNIAGELVASGKLVPDDVLFKILQAEVGDDPSERVLLDGYPRNVAQAETLKGLSAVHPVKAAVHLEVPESELISRLTGRRVCGSCGKSYHVDFDPPAENGVCGKCGGELIQRPDDSIEKVKVRLGVYEEQTAPVLDFYKKEGLYQSVAGTGSQEEVFGEIEKRLGSL